jgi:antitoxin CptB
MGDKLLWRCRRGMRELDVLVEGFYVQCYPSLSAGGQQAFRTLLEQSDPELHDWLLGRVSPPAELGDVVAQMQVFKRTHTTHAGS